MRKIYFLLIAGFVFVNNNFAQNSLFSFQGENLNRSTNGERKIFPQSFSLFSSNEQSLKTFLWSLPVENNTNFRATQGRIMELPMPDGTTNRFNVWESSIMAPGLAAQLPNCKQFLGQGIDDPYATIRFDYNPTTGFHGQILSAKTGRVFIDPFANGDRNNYMSYFARNASSPQRFVCDVDANPSINYPSNNLDNLTEAACLGTTLRTYRLALACTGEYSVAVNGPVPTVAGVAAAMLTAVNRVTGVYENEVAVRMVLVSNNNSLIFLDGTTDPYTNNNGGTMLGQNQTTVDNIIGSANYDIGHVFSTGGGGIAGLGVICANGNKAQGVTGLGNPTGDAFYIDYVAHEMGHQFGGNHTFNSVTGSCNGNRNSTTAYEVGSGTTIQAYAGICGSDDIQPNSDPFFHAISFDEISNRVNATSCAATTATGNNLPVIAALPNNGVTIPVSTPFTLSGSATDADGDALTYCWEQMDLGASGAWNGGATSTTAPLFKSRVPKTTGDRTFPDIAVILAGFPASPTPTMGGLKGETLPTFARAMKFRLTVRDSRAGGGGTVSSGALGCQSSTVYTINTAGSTPFAVTSPNGGESFPGGSTQTITWNNAGTDVAPFNAPNVKISLSTNGGLTYPTVIVASTPNDGSEALTIPAVATTTTARIKIEAVGNIFFDISNNNFSITAPVNGFTFNSPAAVSAACPATTLTSGNLTAFYTGTFNGNINLTSTVTPALPGGASVVFTSPLTTASPSTTVALTGMGSAAPGTYTVTITGTGTTAPNPVQTRDIVFTITAGSGPSITTQPASQTVCAGANVTLTAAANGATGTQWQVSTAAVPTFTNIGGATSGTLTLNAVTAAMSGNQYRCVFTGQCGTSTTNAATLTVNVAPTVTTNPTAQSVCSGNTATFIAGGTGTPAPTYQWQISTAAVPAFTNIGGATNATYTTPATTVAMNGDQYRCVITNACGSVNTTAATLSVSSSVTITLNPTAQTICEGTNTSFTVAAGGSGLTYQWQLSTDGGTNYSNLTAVAPYSGVTTATLAITNAAPGLNTNRYRCVVSSGVCTPGISTGALLTVNTFPLISTQPVAVTICEGANAAFSVTATTGVGSLSYQWQFSANGGGAWNNIAGATTNTFSQTSIPATQNGYQFRVLVTAGCGTTPSNAATLTVNTFPVVTFAAAIPQNICKSDPSFTLSATPAGGAFSGTGVSGTSFSPLTAGVGARIVTYTVSNAGCVTAATRVINVLECAERHRRLPDFQAAFVYPNPHNGQFKIRLNSDLYTKIGARVYNAGGNLVHNQMFTGLTFGSVMSVDVSMLAAGTYMVMLYSDELGGFERKVVTTVMYKQ